jgi:hypothetical protein
MSKAAAELQEELEKCEANKEQVRKMLAQLRAELEEMRQLARGPAPTPAPTPAPAPFSRFLDVGRDYGSPYPQNRRVSSY